MVFLGWAESRESSDPNHFGVLQRIRTQTWFATLVCGLVLIPGFVFGALGADLIQAFRMHFGLVESTGPGSIGNWILFRFLPLAAQGALTGAIAI